MHDGGAILRFGGLVEMLARVFVVGFGIRQHLAWRGSVSPGDTPFEKAGNARPDRGLIARWYQKIRGQSRSVSGLDLSRSFMV